MVVLVFGCAHVCACWDVCVMMVVVVVVVVVVVLRLWLWMFCVCARARVCILSVWMGGCACTNSQ